MRRALALLAAALAGTGVLAGGLALVGGDGTARRGAAPAARTATWTAPDSSFSIATPRGWRASASGAAATVLERRDGRGTVVVRRGGPVSQPLPRLAKSLERRLDRELADFEPVSARTTSVGGRPGLVYTFVRPRANRVQSIVVAPAADASFTLDLVAAGDAPDVAREMGAMVRSFRPRA